jgi:hypothetical protein
MTTSARHRDGLRTLAARAQRAGIGDGDFRILGVGAVLHAKRVDVVAAGRVGAGGYRTGDVAELARAAAQCRHQRERKDGRGRAEAALGHAVRMGRHKQLPPGASRQGQQ